MVLSPPAGKSISATPSVANELSSDPSARKRAAKNEMPKPSPTAMSLPSERVPNPVTGFDEPKGGTTMPLFPNEGRSAPVCPYDMRIGEGMNCALVQPPSTMDPSGAISTTRPWSISSVGSHNEIPSSPNEGSRKPSWDMLCTVQMHRPIIGKYPECFMVFST